MAPKDQSEVLYDDREEAQDETPSTGCGILGRYPVLSVLGFAAVGIAIGLGLSFVSPPIPPTKNNQKTAVLCIFLTPASPPPLSSNLVGS